MDNRQRYEELVGVDTEGNYVVLLGTFHYDDGHHGATGAILAPIPEGRREADMDADDYAERFEDVWRESVARGGETRGLDEWIEDARSSGQLEYYDHSWESVVCRALQDDDIETDAIGCGRIFGGECGVKFAQVYRPDLLKVIESAEA